MDLNTKIKLKVPNLLDELRLQGDLIQTDDPPSLTPTSAKYDLDARALESPGESFETPLLKLITN